MRMAVLGVTGLAGNLSEPPALKVTITATPTDGKANQALMKYLGKLLRVAPSTLEIRRGQTSRDKELFVPGLTPEEVRQILG